MSNADFALAVMSVVIMGAWLFAIFYLPIEKRKK